MLELKPQFRIWSTLKATEKTAGKKAVIALGKGKQVAPGQH